MTVCVYHLDFSLVADIKKDLNSCIIVETSRSEDDSAMCLDNELESLPNQSRGAVLKFSCVRLCLVQTIRDWAQLADAACSTLSHQLI